MCKFSITKQPGRHCQCGRCQSLIDERLLAMKRSPQHGHRAGVGDELHPHRGSLPDAPRSPPLRTSSIACFTSRWIGFVNTGRLFISNHNCAALNKQSPASFLTALLDLMLKDRAQFPVAFQKEPCHPSCRKPKGWSLHERKAGRIARNACADGPQNP
jgi:hypothetical protein